MSESGLHRLAAAAGVDTGWRDAFGTDHLVSEETLRAVLAALGLAAGSEAEAAASLATLQAPDPLPPLLTAEQSGEVGLPGIAPGPYRIVLEDGTTSEGVAQAQAGGASLMAPGVPGYHRLEIAGVETVLAVAPPTCLRLAELAADPGAGRPWAIAVQLYSLRREGDGGLGDFDALRRFILGAGRRGASAVAISPVHAQFSADPDRFSPYAPSSRTMLNVLHAGYDLAGEREAARLESADLVDWPAAARLRLGRLRAEFAAARADRGEMASLAAFRAAGGDPLDQHARFEALHAHFFGADPGKWHWRDWPAPYRDAASPEVAEFARAHADEVALHAYGQMRAEQGLAAAQAAAREAGMSVGLVADLAVGADSGGSQCWANRRETLLGLTIGAPPDLLSREGQSWGLVAFSPVGLRRTGFRMFIDMLRAALRHAGGVRIDHAMSLNRLWVIPEGMSSAEGAYLRFPETDLLRLVALESRRARAVVLAEDLGTVPSGFQQRLQARGISGMRVLWFERDDTGFFSPEHWSPHAIAMTSTHDLPTVAGWWRGRDLDWRERLGLLGEAANAARERETRARERGMLWSAMQASGAASGDAPPADEPARAVDAAVAHAGRSACDLVLLPLEDALGLEEQPNLPGTLHEHPNWQRRIPGDAATLLDGAADRLDAVAKARGAAT